MNSNDEAIIIAPAPDHSLAPICRTFWVILALIFFNIITASVSMASSYLRTKILYSVVSILGITSSCSAIGFVILEQERSVKALKWMWICAIELLLMGAAYPACLYSSAMPQFHRIIGWTMFGFNVVVTVITYYDYLSMKGFGQNEVCPLLPDVEAVVDPTTPQIAA